jgi:hypothetical protein
MSENALPDRDFRGILAEACRPESASVGVGWGQVWGQSRSQLAALQYTGMSPAIMTGHTGIAGCVLPAPGRRNNALHLGREERREWVLTVLILRLHRLLSPLAGLNRRWSPK